MKKLFALILAFCMVLSLAACGGSEPASSATSSAAQEEPASTADEESTSEADKSAPTEEEVEPLDLTGTWYCNNADDEIVFEAIINGDTVIVNMDALGSVWIYWAGSYEAPTDYPDEYTWTSTKDTSLIDDDTLTAPVDTLDFTYSGGVLACIFDLDTGEEAMNLVFSRADDSAVESEASASIETAPTGTVDLAVSPAIIYDNYGITITAELYHHDESQDYIQLTMENNSDMDIEIQGLNFIVNGEEVEDSYYSFLFQELGAGESLGESVYDGIYFEAGTLPDDVDTITSLTFTIHIDDCEDYRTVDEVTVDLTMS